MTQKCLKANVFFNETLLKESAEQAIDVEFTLPDYCPDISKIFKCQATPRVTSKSVSNNSVTIDGTVSILLLYSDKEGSLCSYEYQYPFSKSIEAKGDITGAALACFVKNEYLNCRAVTGRKIDIHGAVGICVNLFKRNADEIVCDLDEPTLELRRGIIPATVPIGYAEKYLTVEEEISLSQNNSASIKNILRTSAVPVVKETKVINDKAVVKGEIKVCILFCSEGAKTPQMLKTTLPFSQIVDVAGVTDTCNCDTKAQIASLEVKPRVSSSGESKSFSFAATLLLCCECYCGNDIAVITDAFSRKFSAEIKRKKVNFKNIAKNVCETFNCKKTLTFDDEISSIIDLSCTVSSAITRFKENCMTISGAITAAFIFCNHKGDVIYCEKPIDFEYKIPHNLLEENLSCDPQITLNSCNFTIISDNTVELMIELNINAAIYENTSTELISDIEVDENNLISKRRKGAMTVYFPSQNECVWDIARIYLASVDEIMRINDLEGQTVKQRRMILIPMS